MKFEEGKVYRVINPCRFKFDTGDDYRDFVLTRTDYFKYHEGVLICSQHGSLPNADRLADKFEEVILQKIYLSLPITGREAAERRAFANEMIEFVNRTMPWYEVVNPLDNKLEYDVHWSKHMKADIAMLIECDAIYMCKDWQWSHGCKLEHDIATSCGLDVFYHDSAWFAPVKK